MINMVIIERYLRSWTATLESRQLSFASIQFSPYPKYKTMHKFNFHEVHIVAPACLLLVLFTPRYAASHGDVWGFFCVLEGTCLFAISGAAVFHDDSVVYTEA